MEMIDLTIRYQSIKLNYYGFHWTYYCWTLGIGIISGVIFFNKKPSDLLRINSFISSYNSSRCKTALGIGLSSFISVLGVIFLMDINANDEFKVNKIIILVFFIWLFSNTISIQKYSHFIKVNKQINENIINFNTKNKIDSIKHRTFVFESDNLITGFNHLLSAHLNLSKQVKHDLSAPIMNLRSFEDDPLIPSQARQSLKNVSNRIKGIIDTLPAEINNKEVIRTTMDNDKTIPTQCILTLVENIVLESRARYRNISGLRFIWNPENYYYVLINKKQIIELQRVISNIIDNSVDAILDISDSGVILVDLTGDSDHVQIQIKDTGKGIPPQILPYVMNSGFTFEKKNGSGLGLYHAKTTLESLKGSCVIKSELNTGTEITLRFPTNLKT